MRGALFIARMDAWNLLRRRETILWTFIMPVVFIYFIGTITGRSVGSTDSKDDLAVSVSPDSGFLADELIGRLEARNYRVVRTGDHQQFLNSSRRLEIPPGFTASVLRGTPVKLKFSRTGEDVAAWNSRVAATGRLTDCSASIATGTGDAPFAETLTIAVAGLYPCFVATTA